VRKVLPSRALLYVCFVFTRKSSLRTETPVCLPSSDRAVDALKGNLDVPKFDIYSDQNKLEQLIPPELPRNFRS
jgi:hypothetical protein